MGDWFQDKGIKPMLIGAEGEAFDSTLTTSSRVIARLPGGVDTDSSDDFFITAARRSTFGEENEYVPYQGP